MTPALDLPLGSFATHDEFQAGRCLVNVLYPEGCDRAAALRAARARLPVVWADIATACVHAARAVGASPAGGPARVLAIDMAVDGSALYTLDVDGREGPDLRVMLIRAADGGFGIARVLAPR